MEIRFATVQDVPRIHEIVQAAYRTEGASWTSEAEWVRGERITQDELCVQLSQEPLVDPIWVAVDPRSQQVVGCIAAEASHLHPQLQLPERSALLGLLAVDPSMQSRGIGSRLLRACLTWVQKGEWQCELAVLWVLEPRVEIQAWYERFGFQWTGRYRPFVFPEKLRVPGHQFRIYHKKLVLSGV